MCTETTSSLTCTFTDFSHSIKSDTFTFALKPNLPSGTVVVAHTDVVTGSGTPPTGGEASDQATYTIP